MSTAVKASAFAVFARVFLIALEPLRAEWTPVLWVLAVCTMILGSVVGVAQTNLKRMLAYSSIAHGGYLLVALAAGDEVGRASILFYLVVYAITNLGAFAVLALLGTREAPMENLDEYKGLWHSAPVMAALLTIFLLSLGGFPPAAGFIAKWYIFQAAVSEGYVGLAVIGVLTSVVSVFYYLRIIVSMFMAVNQAEFEVPRTGVAGLSALALTAAGTFYLGVLPARLMDIAAQSISTIF
jgi:NADH-quinone oxidoreductase subunit N